MPKLFKIEVTEKYSMIVKIKAESPEEAFEKLGDMEINMTAEHYVSDSTEYSAAKEVTDG